MDRKKIELIKHQYDLVTHSAEPSKQLKMLLGWAAFHQEELLENWDLAEKKQDLFPIDPLK